MPEETAELKESLASVLQIAKRRRWWILASFFCVTLGAIAVSYFLPAQYRSEARILVEQQQVPERYVTPTTTADLIQTLQVMTQDILSRTQLLPIINEFNLYPAEAKRLGPEELVQLMRTNIKIEPLVQSPERKGSNAFILSFVGSNPVTARQVVNRLSSLFRDENLKLREQQSIGTTNFLEDQLTAARADLEEQEKRLRDFKMEHLGELPQEQQGNLQILSGLQMQLQNTMAGLGRARQQQVYLESLLAQYRSLSPKAGPDSLQQGASRVKVLEKQLSDLRAQRAVLLSQYTPEHPDVLNADRQIKQMESLLALVRKNSQDAVPGDAAASAALQVNSDDDPAIAQLKSQLKANQVEIANGTASEKQLQGRIAEYQRRLNVTPVREQQLAEVLRNYDLSQKNYADLEGKRNQSALAARLEQDQQGQQLRIVDPANLPAKPFSPDRAKMGLMGAMIGLVLGMAIASALELEDTSFHSEREVSRHLTLPFVLGVPQLSSPTEDRRRSRRRVFEWLGASLMITVVLAAELVVFLRG